MWHVCCELFSFITFVFKSVQWTLPFPYLWGFRWSRSKLFMWSADVFTRNLDVFFLFSVDLFERKILTIIVSLRNVIERDLARSKQKHVRRSIRAVKRITSYTFFVYQLSLYLIFCCCFFHRKHLQYWSGHISWCRRNLSLFYRIVWSFNSATDCSCPKMGNAFETSKNSKRRRGTVY